MSEIGWQVIEVLIAQQRQKVDLRVLVQHLSVTWLTYQAIRLGVDKSLDLNRGLFQGLRDPDQNL